MASERSEQKHTYRGCQLRFEILESAVALYVGLMGIVLEVAIFRSID